ncbi:MAG: hypothetical protein A2097_02850 [Desulfobacula sp. GWF2_41_7]|nr:MAG: hypothetical protein A2097_02850 [Desulfobacula sp. GWF2_41_7]
MQIKEGMEKTTKLIHPHTLAYIICIFLSALIFAVDLLPRWVLQQEFSMWQWFLFLFGCQNEILRYGFLWLHLF